METFARLIGSKAYVLLRVIGEFLKITKYPGRNRDCAYLRLYYVGLVLD